MCSQNVTSRGINQKISARYARSIVLYPTLKTVTLLVIPTVSWVWVWVTIAPKILAAPISVVWLYAWLGPKSQQTYFQLRAAFLSLAPIVVQKVTTPLPLAGTFEQSTRRCNVPRTPKNITVIFCIAYTQRMLCASGQLKSDLSKTLTFERLSLHFHPVRS